MIFKEKSLYHQIHPLKLSTDILSEIISLYFLWTRAIWIGLALHFIPPVIASLLLIQYANLEPQKSSRLGKYVCAHMSTSTQAFRLTGDIVMVFGAWDRSPIAILAGLVIILAAWMNGILGKQ